MFAAIVLACLPLCLLGCKKETEHVHAEAHKILVTCATNEDVVLTQQYVCQIHSYRHIDICALENGYLEEIPVKEGQWVKQGETMFQVRPVLYQAKLDADVAEEQLAKIELQNTDRLFKQNVVAQPEVALAQAKLSRAQAKVQQSQAELNFATIRAPFDGIIDHQNHQQGSLIAEGDMLTTLSDNSVMWVYFNVTEARYLEYKQDPNRDDLKVELVLANGQKFPQVGKISAIEADFDNHTGNIAFRADFPNPDGLLRHGQTGTILLSRVLKNAVVIPQRSKYEILAKNYVYVVQEPTKQPTEQPVAAVSDSMEPILVHGEPEPVLHKVEPIVANASDKPDEEAKQEHVAHSPVHHGELGVVHQREIFILNELDDIYLIKSGLEINDRIVLEGIRQVHDGDEVEYEYVTPEQILGHQKYHAE